MSAESEEVDAEASATEEQLVEILAQLKPEDVKFALDMVDAKSLLGADADFSKWAHVGQGARRATGEHGS